MDGDDGESPSNKRGRYRKYLYEPDKYKVPRTTERRLRQQSQLALIDQQVLVPGDVGREVQQDNQQIEIPIVDAEAGANIEVEENVDAENVGREVQQDNQEIETPYVDAEAGAMEVEENVDVENETYHDQFNADMEAGHDEEFTPGQHEDPTIDQDAGKAKQSEVDYVTKYRLNSKLHRDFPRTRLEVLLMIMHMAYRHCLTQHFIEDQIAFVNSLFGSDVLDISYHIFKRLFKPTTSIMRHYFCPTCELHLLSKKVGSQDKGSQTVKCGKCSKDINVGSAFSKNFFVTLGIREQIESILAEPDLQLVDRTNRNSDYIFDVFDGAHFKYCCESGLPLKDAFTVTFNTDGVAVQDSTHNSMYPILVHLNEIVPEQRFLNRNMILAGVWFGRGSPNMALFMKPFIQELLDLSQNGVECRKSDGSIVKCPVFAIACSVDSITKPKLLCKKQFNAFSGCLYCTHPNDSTVEGIPSNQRFYDTNQSYPLRTEESVIKDMYEADGKDQEGDLGNASVNGFLGISVLLLFVKLLNTFPCNSFHIVWSVVIDYMHAVLEGVTSDLLELFCKVLGPENVSKLNDRLSLITPPQALTRKPRTLKEKLHWKAKELRAFLLYYSLPCLQDLLPQRHFNNLKYLVNSMHILLRDKISHLELQEAGNALNLFVRGFQSIYGLSSVTYNLHLLTHLREMVYRAGGLWCYSNFPFEGANGQLVKLIRGNRSICTEVAYKFTTLQTVSKIIQKYPVSDEALNFCHKILGFKHSKLSRRVDEVRVTGSNSWVEISNEDLTLLQGYNVEVSNQKVLVHNRVIRKGIVYACKSYTKSKVHDDTCVLLTDGRYATIDKMIVTTDDKLICIIRPLRIAGEIIPDIKQCPFHCYDDACVIPFKYVHRKCVLITVEDKRFVSHIPNCYEPE